MKSKLLVIFFVITAALTIAAQGEIPSVDEVLEAASGPLVGSVVAAILSGVVELWPKYNELTARAKRIVFFVLCLFVPVGAACLRAALGFEPWSFDPLVWHALWNGLAAGGVGTLLHSRKLATV